MTLHSSTIQTLELGIKMKHAQGLTRLAIIWAVAWCHTKSGSKSPGIWHAIFSWIASSSFVLNVETFRDMWLSEYCRESERTLSVSMMGFWGLSVSCGTRKEERTSGNESKVVSEAVTSGSDEYMRVILSMARGRKRRREGESSEQGGSVTRDACGHATGDARGTQDDTRYLFGYVWDEPPSRVPVVSFLPSMSSSSWLLL